MPRPRCAINLLRNRKFSYAIIQLFKPLIKKRKTTKKKKQNQNKTITTATTKVHII